jgi:iron complex outermembrane receptor protein
MLLHRTLRFNMAGFYTKFDDIQKVLTASNGVQTILNAANATIYGLELEMTAMPTDGLEFNAAFGWTHARYDEFNGLDLTGDGVPDPARAKKLLFERVPEYSVTVGASYRFSVGPGDLSLRTSYAFKSAMFVNLVNTPSMKVPAFGLLDASATYELNQRWRITVYGRNLTNTQYWDTGVNFNWGDALFGGEARSFGVELGFKF